MPLARLAAALRALAEDVRIRAAARAGARALAAAGAPGAAGARTRLPDLCEGRAGIAARRRYGAVA